MYIMNVVDIKNLSVGFETEVGFKEALHGITFSIKRGQMLAVVGESGCGKTLSAMSILRLLPKSAKITDGKILFNGENLLKLSEKELRKIRGAKIALIPQDPMTSLNPLYTIGNQLIEIINLAQNIYGKEAKTIATEALDAVQIPSAKEKLLAYPHELSGGMKQRAIIAMALACHAEVLIADEPTTALDVTIQAQIMDLLNSIKTENKTSILLITHDLSLVENVADEVSVMYAGKIIENADVKDFFINTKHPYSKALLKAIPSKSRENLFVLSGHPPNINEKICGCNFHPRCEFAFDKCTKEIPDTININNTHTSSC